MKNEKLRVASWAVGASSLALPAAYFSYQQHEFHIWAEKQGGLVCGMPALAILFISIFCSTVLSAIAGILNGINLRSQASKRSCARYFELILLSFPFLAGAAIILVALIS